MLGEASLGEDDGGWCGVAARASSRPPPDARFARPTVSPARVWDPQYWTRRNALFSRCRLTVPTRPRPLRRGAAGARCGSRSTPRPRTLADSHGLNKAARLSEGERDKQDAGAPAPSSKFRKRWQRAKFALAFRARDDAEHREAKDIAAAWDGASTSEDERSMANSDDPDEDDDDVNDENRKDATLAELRARAREELLAKEKALCDAVPRRDPSDPSAPRITKIVWSFQNLKRVPPGFIRLEGVRDGLESLDLSMNILTKAPSNLAGASASWSWTSATTG